ncbi:MAG: M24 family metallopeptidase [Calditrichia bacterium]
MVIGVGGSTAEKELGKLSDMTAGVKPIQSEEFEARLAKARNLMKQEGFAAVYLHAGTNLYYFTGMKWNASERMVGVLVTADGLDYIAPAFEHGTVMGFMKISGDLHCWEEHESPYELFGVVLKQHNIHDGKIGMDESAPFFITDGLRLANPGYLWENAKAVTAGCRAFKSDSEIAIIQRAKEMTMAVQKSAAKILYPGISAKEMVDFIHAAHKKVGAPAGSYFCIILFGEDTQYPHGVPVPRDMREGDVVLVDTGCQLHGYISDITRTYVYGEPTDRQREIWDLEKKVQQAAFDASQLGASCSEVDDASRAVLVKAGLGPDYKLPGLAHRTGHGTGLDIHEYPYIVRGNSTLLESGMVFSNEPMICVPGEFGIRLEDHIYMTDAGPRWFTQPMKSIDDPFGE